MTREQLETYMTQAVVDLGSYHPFSDVFQEAATSLVRRAEEYNPKDQTEFNKLLVAFIIMTKRWWKKSPLRTRDVAVEETQTVKHAKTNTISGVSEEVESAREYLGYIKNKLARRVCELIYIEGMSSTEASAVLNMPDRTIRWYRNRGIETIQKALRKEGLL